MSDLPPNMREALETELAGVERRLAVATEADQQANLARRAGEIRAALGLEVPSPAKRAKRETRPNDAGVETREA